MTVKACPAVSVDGTFANTSFVAEDGNALPWLQRVDSIGVNGVHAFVVDTLVASDRRHSGIGRHVLDVAQRESRAAGCEWLHVDFEEDLRDFYFGACGFTPTPAGLIALR